MTRSHTLRPSRLPHSISLNALMILCLAAAANGVHHMKRAPLNYVLQRDETVPLVVKNLCSENIYPGIVTQSGTAPSSGGFELTTGSTKNLTVGQDWQGRVWGRTNCSFNAQGTAPNNNGGLNGGGKACTTGDCGGIVNCKATVSYRSLRDQLSTDGHRVKRRLHSQNSHSLPRVAKLFMTSLWWTATTYP